MPESMANVDKPNARGNLPLPKDRLRDICGSSKRQGMRGGGTKPNAALDLLMDWWKWTAAVMCPMLGCAKRAQTPNQ